MAQAAPRRSNSADPFAAWRAQRFREIADQMEEADWNGPAKSTQSFGPIRVHGATGSTVLAPGRPAPLLRTAGQSPPSPSAPLLQPGFHQGPLLTAGPENSTAAASYPGPPIH